MFSKIWVFLVKSQEWVMFFTSIALASLVTLAVFLRYIFRIDLYGIEEVEILIAMWLYFIGAAYGSYTRTQISADIVEALVPEGRVKDAARCARSVISVVLYCGLLYLAVDMLIFNLSANIRTAVWKIPGYFIPVGVCLGLGLMTFYGVVEMRDVFTAAFGGDRSSEQDAGR